MFKRARNNYGETPVPVTPYQKAGQIWDERIGSARVQARNWRLMAFGCLIFASCASAALVWRSLQSAVTPYVVEVSEFGEVRAIGPATEHYAPNDAQIAHHLASFLVNVRSLSVDPIVVRQNWLTAYDYVIAEAASALDEYARANDPFSQVGITTRTVEVTSIVRLSDDTFQARWTEKTFEHGSQASTQRFTGLLSITITPPRDAETLRANPLGLYIHSLNWGQELTQGDL
ncbi:MAG: conjugal transfer protein TrbF [Hyphomonadaceae bacterium]